MQARMATHRTGWGAAFRGGLAFTGPSTGDFGEEVDGGGARFTYDATLLPGRGSVGLQINLYSSGAWDRVKGAQDVQGVASSPGVTITDVTIAGHAGRILESHDRLGTLEEIRLIVQLVDTTVLAIAGHTYSATPAPDANPLTDKQTFLAVMQNLRPYPQ